jgi:taurine---2-oxoglutarate transaminase
VDAKAMIEGCRAHSLFTWSRGRDVDPLPVVGAQGVWLQCAEGERLLDFNSQSMNAHLGHAHPRLVAAIKAQADQLVSAAPAWATEVRARVSAKLAAVLPGDLNKLLYTLGGAEANENAVRMARAVTGRQKILSRYRSYHGATSGAIQLTGDPRRWHNEPGAPGFIHLLDAQPYGFSFAGTAAEQAAAQLRYTAEVIAMEGPQTIAAMVLEPVPGTNGVLPFVPGYLRDLKALLSRHGILMICDEVMTGFGRTGPMFAVQHDDVVPDMMTLAKGISGAHLPFGAVAVSDAIAAHFEDHVLWGGLTCNAYPLGLAVAEEVLTVIRDEGVLENVRARGEQLAAGLDALVAKHAVVETARSVGLLGMVDLVPHGEGALAAFNQTHPHLPALKAALRRLGLVTFARWRHVCCMPPLVISEAELAQGLQILDAALSELPTN